MTLQKLVRAWIASPTPVYSILNGNLDAKFIKPFGEHLRRAGVDIRTNCQVKKLMRVGDRISGFVTEQGLEQEKELTPTENDAFVLATPHRITLDILAGRNIAAATTKAMEESTDPEEYGLAGLAHLRSLPMAALHVHFKRRISDFPPEGHVNLIDSRFAMNVLEVSQHWDELKDRTTLYAIASNYEPLIALGEARAKAVLLEELFQYFPHLKNEPFEAVLQGHENEPLLVNTIGAWHFRPRAKTGVPNLFVAGDYCRTDVDLTTMESAVMSGMQTARAVSAFLGLPRPPAPERLPSAPLPVLMALRAAALPLIAPVGAVKWLQRQVDDILNAKWW
jgi:uncharacterized protein with NAD-binding domain and iron-sulfur cluster